MTLRSAVHRHYRMYLALGVWVTVPPRSSPESARSERRAPSHGPHHPSAGRRGHPLNEGDRVCNLGRRTGQLVSGVRSGPGAGHRGGRGAPSVDAIGERLVGGRGRIRTPRGDGRRRGADDRTLRPRPHAHNRQGRRPGDDRGPRRRSLARAAQAEGLGGPRVQDLTADPDAGSDAGRPPGASSAASRSYGREPR